MRRLVTLSPAALAAAGLALTGLALTGFAADPPADDVTPAGHTEPAAETDAAASEAEPGPNEKQETDVEARRRRARERFDYEVREDLFAGFAGDAEALARGLATCEAKLKAEPEHAQAMVWRGAGRMFLAGQKFQTGDTLGGFTLWSQALADMDRAVEIEPDDIGVRIPRAAVLVGAGRNAPPAMGRPLLEKVRGDFELILETHEGHIAAAAAKGRTVTPSDIGEHPWGELRMGLADVYRLLGEREKSRAQLEAVRADLPGTDYATRAGEWLRAEPDATLAHNCLGCHGG